MFKNSGSVFIQTPRHKAVIVVLVTCMSPFSQQTMWGILLTMKTLTCPGLHAVCPAPHPPCYAWGYWGSPVPNLGPNLERSLLTVYNTAVAPPPHRVSLPGLWVRPVQYVPLVECGYWTEPKATCPPHRIQPNAYNNYLSDSAGVILHSLGWSYKICYFL